MNTTHSPKNRRDFLKWAGAVGAFVTLSGCTTSSSNNEPRPTARMKESTGSSGNDVKILQDALALEHKGIAAYAAGIASNLLDATISPVALKFKGHHEQHRDKLTKTIQSLGAKPVEAMEKYDFGVLASQDDILKLAVSIEELAAFSYAQGAGDLSDHGLVVAAISIVGCECWHTAVLKSALKEDPAPSAFLQ